MRKRYIGLLLLSALGFYYPEASGQNRPETSKQVWVSTWATAQQLLPTSFPMRPGPPPQNGTGPQAGRSQAVTATAQPARPPQQPNSPVRPIPAAFEDQTIRMVVHTSIGGRTLRVALSNMLNAQPLEIGSAHVALHKGGGAIVPGSDRALKFGGNDTCVIPPGALFLSDPVDLQVAPFSDLAVSLYLPKNTGPPTNHPLGLRTAYISKGNVTGSEVMPEPETAVAYFWLSSVDVLVPAGSYAIVALGDSITDGYSTTLDANAAWPSLLAKRLAGNKATRNVSVVNQGISGNQVLRDGAGVSALARFDRDVLSRPGVKWVILLEGINDINIRGRSEGPGALTAEELIAGYRQIIERARVHGIKVIGATLMPEEGVPTASPRGEEIRQAVNRWIRAKGNFDAVVDFDRVVQDPARPARLNPAYDPGDHIHPNDAGNQAMADAFDLRVFSR